MSVTINSLGDALKFLVFGQDYYAKKANSEGEGKLSINDENRSVKKNAPRSSNDFLSSLMQDLKTFLFSDDYFAKRPSIENKKIQPSMDENNISVKIGPGFQSIANFFGRLFS